MLVLNLQNAYNVQTDVAPGTQHKNNTINPYELNEYFKHTLRKIPFKLARRLINY
jgi:hypothetical protein